jgi:cytochrome c peroxidase
LNAEEIKGMELFFSEKTNCSKCHNGFLFTDFSFQSLGLPNRTHDPGRMRISREDSDSGKFKTPGLRNVALTYPYMHDGSLHTLEEVVEFYDQGGGNSPNKSTWIKPLALAVEEKKALIRFLHTLTDTVPR